MIEPKVEPKVEWEPFKVEVDEEATPLMLAAGCGNYKIMKLLIAKDANIHAQNAKNWTALHYAAEQGHTPCVNLLLAKTENRQLVDTINDDGDTPFILAAKHGQIETLITLYEYIRFQTGINSIGQKNMTALGWAVQNAHVNCVEYLLRKKADTTIVDENGKTPAQLVKDMLEGENIRNIPNDKLNKYIIINQMIDEHSLS